MTHYLGIIGNIAYTAMETLNSSRDDCERVRGYEDVTSCGLEFSLASRATSVGCGGHNLDGEPSVNLHQALYESINNMFASKTSPAFVLVPEFMSRAVHLLPA